MTTKKKKDEWKALPPEVTKRLVMVRQPMRESTGQPVTDDASSKVAGVKQPPK